MPTDKTNLLGILTIVASILGFIIACLSGHSDASTYATATQGIVSGWGLLHAAKAINANKVNQ